MFPHRQIRTVRNRIGGAGGNLCTRGFGQSIATVSALEAEEGSINDRAFGGSSARVPGSNHREQRRRRAAAGGVGQLPRDRQVSRWRPDIDEDILIPPQVPISF